MAGAIRTVTVRLPMDMYERVEAARGKVPREPWIRDAIDQRLTRVKPRGSVRSPRRTEPGRAA